PGHPPWDHRRRAGQPVSNRRSFGDWLRFNLCWWPTRALVRVRQAVYTWRYAHFTSQPPSLPDYTITAGAVAAALAAAGLADHPAEVRIPREPWYRAGRGWSAWADLPRPWNTFNDADPA